MCVVQNEIDGLVESFQGSNEVSPVGRDDGDHPVHVGFQRGSHLESEAGDDVSRDGVAISFLFSFPKKINRLCL